MSTHSKLMLEKASEYDKVCVVKTEVSLAISKLKEFRKNYPFTENFATIEWLEQDKLFKVNPDAVGDFFRFLEDFFKPFTTSSQNNSNVARNARLQISEFKKLLRTVVDDRKSLAEKIEAPWQKIGGIAPDKQIAKQIIFCFNCEKGNILPIVNTQHLRHFVNRIVDSPNIQTKYFSPGQEYESYTTELLKTKNSLPITKSWNVVYFARFLYQTYSPPDSEQPSTNPSSGTKTINVVTDEQLELRAFAKLLVELQSKGKITGQQFRENRELWMQQQPNDRSLLIGRLKQLLNPENKSSPDPSRIQSDEPPKRPRRQRL